MALTIHHMEISQSERILFLCQELGVPYTLVRHKRAPMLSPESLKSVSGNHTGKAPFIEDPDNNITLSESGAICEYILAKSGDTKLTKKYGDRGYADYVYWFHYANGGLQPAMMGEMFLMHSVLPEDDPTRAWVHQRLVDALKHIDEQLRDNKWLAGEDFTAADVMTVYSLTTQRYFGPNISYSEFPNIGRYLGDIAQRPGYKKAMEKGDPEMKLLVGVEGPETTIIRQGGIDGGVWKK